MFDQTLPSFWRRRATRINCVAFLVLLPTCKPVRGVAPAPAVLALQGETIGRDSAEIVRLDAAEVARLAEEARQEVSVQMAPGLELTLWAPEQFLADPIALSIDDQGRVYATGTGRTRGGLDIRGHPDWVIEAHALKTVEDLRGFFRRRLAPERSDQNQWLPDMNKDGSRDWRDLTANKERVFRIVDTTGDGRADLSQVILEDFNTEVTDVAGGLLVHDNALYVGVAPDLWRVRDTNGNGVIDYKESISHGYGVHPGFGGHGVSGVTMGPDGRIYWSVGDMGMNVTDREGRRWVYPNQGTILRSNPDGTGFEVFAAGLRNTHEFEFDEYGNLISVDNDGDHPGETERLVYITDGSDSGWRSNWQWGKYTDPDNNAYKVWMDEGLYKPRFPGQAAYITPPLAAYHTGPSGMVYNPGTALSERWRDHFFVSEFTGSPATSKIHAFRLEEKGAGFALARDTVMIRGILTTGLEFGPDGALYLADWIEGWGAKGKGRIWKVDAADASSSALTAETRALLRASFDSRSAAELATLLRHADMRVRLKAQFELAERSAARTLLGAARQREHKLARLHGLWGIGQLARKDPRHAAALSAFLRDADPEIRAQAAKVIGDVRYAGAGNSLLPLLRDSSPRARFFAAEALGRIEHRPAVQPLIAMLEANNDEDVYLRHAGTLALARIGQAEPVVALADHPSRGLRTAAVVALRRMQHPGVARFLADRDEYIVTEAARAINDDASIEAALPDLARVLEQERFTSEPLLRRAISANLRLGTPEAARRVAAFAARSGAPDTLRVDAIAALGVWPKPSVLDRVDGMYRGSSTRDTTIARVVVMPLVEPLLAAGSTAVKIALAETIGRLDLDAAAPALLARLREDPAAPVRVAAVKALHAIGSEGMESVLRTALADRDPSVRMTALGLVPSLGLPEATTAELLASVVGRGTVEEQQSALAALGKLRGPQAARVLTSQLDRFAAGTLPAEIHLDLMEAVEAGGSPALQARLERRMAARAQGNTLAAFHEALLGGNTGRGRQVVFQNAAGQCTRCHAVGPNGPNVGPNLAQIGTRLTREQLLEALVDPSARIAPGYGGVVLKLRNGGTVSGTLREETGTHVVVQTGGEETSRIAKADISQRTNAPSAMPPMGHLLSRRELRDVVEYLSTLR